MTEIYEFPKDSHIRPPRNQRSRRDPIPVGTRVRHYGTRMTATVVAVDGPYQDGGWEYQVAPGTTWDGAYGPEVPRWWPDRAITLLVERLVCSEAVADHPSWWARWRHRRAARKLVLASR